MPRLVHRLTFLPASLRAMDSLLPAISTRYQSYRRPAPALGASRGRVAFFAGCVQDAFLSGVNQATIRVLQHNGYEVHFPDDQTCCGAAPLHAGEGELARDLARRNIGAFLAESYDAVVNNAGGCGAMLKDYPLLLADDAEYRGKAILFSSKVRDIAEFLVEHGAVPPAGTVPALATYADSCHLRHAQHVLRAPRQLLAAIPGLTLVELKQPDRCCGSAGVYNILRPETADAILDDKMADIAATGCDLIVTTNAGCYMQLSQGARRAGLAARVVHLVELLDQSYEANGGDVAPKGNSK